MRLIPRRPYRHQHCPGNSLELLAGGAAFYPAIEQAVARARREVLVETYLWEPDERGLAMLRLLADAARRGLRVAVLVDGIGSRGLDAAVLADLRGAGGEVAVYHPVRLPLISSRLFRRLHSKLVLVDGEVAFVGGAGFARYWTEAPPAEWWDLMTRVSGPALEALRQSFSTDWRVATRRRLERLATTGAPGDTPRGDVTAQVLTSRHGRPELTRRLLAAIYSARRSVDLANAYFVPSFPLRRALRRASGRGVSVRLLLPGPRTDHLAVWNAGRRHYQRLLNRGVAIHEWQRGMFHGKYAAVDDAWGYVGSSNLDGWSGRLNRELDLGVSSPAAVAALRERFEADLEQARPMTLDVWRARPLSLRIAEEFFGWFDPWL